jgi:two-component system, NtrC family, sensor kinase
MVVVGAALIISAAVNFLVIYGSIFPKFLELEKDAATKDVQRVLQAIDAEIEGIKQSLWDYTNWDDTYNYILHPNDEYTSANLKPDSLENIRMNVIEIYNTKHDLLFSGRAENTSASRYEWRFKEVVDFKSLENIEQSNNVVEGLVSTPGGLVMFAVRPVLTSRGNGPSVGVFFFGRFLDDSLIAEIGNKTKVDVELVNLDLLQDKLGANASNRLAEQDVPAVSEDQSRDRLVTYWLLRDYRGKAIGALRAYTERDVSKSGRDVVLASIIGVGVAGLIVMAAIAALLQWLLVGPLIRLTQHVVGIGRSGDLGQRVSLHRNDEIGALSQEFDRMLGGLAEARDQLLEQSYKSGIAEMASGVLHNMRNQLMPVNMRLGRLREAVARSSHGKLEKALDEMKNADPERVEKLANYVTLVVRDLVRRQDALREQLTAVSYDLARIEEILHELDRFSHASARLEAVSVGELVDQTIGLLPEFPDLHVRIRVDPMLKTRHDVMSVGFMLKHVLHNLFINAFEAIMATGKHEGTIEVALAFKTVDGLAMADLQVRDDGIGIAHENVKEIFVRGFTTKQKGGRRGTGLHWCANRVAAMGGKLYAESPGINRGATFHVLLPLAAAPPIAAQ